jgi:copper(I)-binding protein
VGSLTTPDGRRFGPFVGARPAAALAVLALSVGVASCGKDHSGDGVSVDDVWARPTAVGVAVGSVYLALESPVDDALIGVSVPPDVAARASLHVTETVDDFTEMAPVERLDLPAGERVVIEPGGTHVMLEGLAAPLTAGDSFDLTLDFETAPDQAVTVDVDSGGS